MKFVEIHPDDVFDNHENMFVVFENQEYKVICVQRELEPPTEAVAEVDWPRRTHRYTHKTYAVPV